MTASACRALGHQAIASVQAHDLLAARSNGVRKLWEVRDYSKGGAKVMSTKMVGHMGRAICLTVICLSFTLLAAASEQTNIAGTWQLNHLESDKTHQNVQQIDGRRGSLIDSVADEREKSRGMPYDPLMLMIGGISSPPENLAVGLDNSNVTLSDGKRASLTLHTDGRVEEFGHGIQIITRWANDTLVIAIV